ncbi:MAG: alpha/beta fold hydrolase [bacterium]
MRPGYFVSLLMDALSFGYMNLFHRSDTAPSSPESIDDYIRRNRAGDPRKFFSCPGGVPDLRITGTIAMPGFEIHDFQFPSSVITGHDRNDVVRGRVYEKRTCGGRPFVILLHGWRMESHLAFDRFARLFMKAGYNSLLLDLPYHMRRTPPRAFSGEYSFSTNALRTLEALRQSVLDVRSALNWLKVRGVPRVGVFGVSLGGLLAGLVTCVEDRLDFSVLVVPGTDVAEMFRKSRLGRMFQRENPEAGYMIEKYGDYLRTVSLPSLKPLVPVSRVLIIEAIYDRFVPRELVERLWDAWGRPPILRYPHGHLSVIALNPKLDGDLKKFLVRMRSGTGAAEGRKGEGRGKR